MFEVNGRDFALLNKRGAYLDPDLCIPTRCDTLIRGFVTIQTLAKHAQTCYGCTRCVPSRPVLAGASDASRHSQVWAAQLRVLGPPWSAAHVRHWQVLDAACADPGGGAPECEWTGQQQRPASLPTPRTPQRQGIIP